jgi:TRAP-type C4-dicarboxylate transport system substrate-binding protein
MVFNRRRLWAALAFGAAGLFCTAASAQTIELKLSHYLPPNHTIHKFLEAWAADVAQRSGGRMTVKIYPASQLGPVQRQYDLARSGQADLAIGLTGATPGRYPMTELASLPFVWPKDGSTSNITSKRLTELVPKYLAPEYEGLHVLWIGVTPTNGIFTARKALSKVADIQGLKIRFQGEQPAKVLRLLGAVPLQVPPGEIADGMSKGVIDGALFDYEAAESFGLGPIAHYVSENGFFTATLGFVMNAARYDSLPPDLKAIIDDTTGPKAAEALGLKWDEAERHGHDYMKSNNATITPLAADQVDIMKTTLAPLLDDSVDALEKSGKPARAFVDDYRK